MEQKSGRICSLNAPCSSNPLQVEWNCHGAVKLGRTINLLCARQCIERLTKLEIQLVEKSVLDLARFRADITISCSLFYHSTKKLNAPPPVNRR